MGVRRGGRRFTARTRCALEIVDHAGVEVGDVAGVGAGHHPVVDLEESNEFRSFGSRTSSGDQRSGSPATVPTFFRTRWSSLQ